MSILVDGAAEPVSSADIEVRDLFRIGNRFRERAQWCGSPESPVGPVLVIEVLELPERVQEVPLRWTDRLAGLLRRPGVEADG